MEDIPQLVEHFLAKYRFAPDAIPTSISEEAMARLMDHDWPGNVRELENAIERAVVLSRGATIMPEHLPLAESPASAGGRARSRKAATKAAESAATSEADGPPTDGASIEDAMPAGATNGKTSKSFKDAVESLEKRLIAEALARNAGNRSKAAEELGIYRRLLYAKMREYGLGEE
jgi:DNA-binding NtrC family response regulator